MNAVHRRLKAWREEQGYAQWEVGQLLGVSQTFYSFVERGIRRPGLRVIATIADVTDDYVPVSMWFSRAEIAGSPTLRRDLAFLLPRRSTRRRAIVDEYRKAS
jgi:transcriptional regulator with XRE-family HTH domain